MPFFLKIKPGNRRINKQLISHKMTKMLKKLLDKAKMEVPKQLKNAVKAFTEQVTNCL